MTLKWLNKNKLLIGVVFVLVFLVATGIILHIYSPDSAGFSSSFTTNTELDTNDQPIKKITIERLGKTYWDWLSVFVIPVSLVVLGVLLQQLQQRRADEEAKEEVLQVYFDRISELLVDKDLIGHLARIRKAQRNPQAHPNLDEQKELLWASVNVIRARTLSILRRFGDDGKRKGNVIQFLRETGVISKLELKFKDADLSHASLKQLNLHRANFDGVKLNQADLSNANLTGANLGGANLTGANLKGAYLARANLRSADLKGATFKGANLNDADLGLAKNWTKKQLKAAKLCRTVLPEGCKLNHNRDC